MKTLHRCHINPFTNMNNIERHWSKISEEIACKDARIAALEAEKKEALEIVGCSNPGYYLKSLKALVEKNALLESQNQQLIEAANTNSYSNLFSKVTTAFSNEPAPPSEQELAYAAEQAETHARVVSQALTISVFDSILFAICNWSNDGQTAPDIELAMQSVLFPSVYERVLQDNQDYVLETMPESALDVVKKGRELIRDLRAETDRFVTDQDLWNDLAPRLQSWVKNEMLHSLYGASDPQWLTDQPLSLEQMITWRDMPASRALEQPLIWDAYEKTKLLTYEDKEEYGLPDFNKEQVANRIDAEQTINR